MTHSILRLALAAVLGLLEGLETPWAGADHGCNIDPDGKPRCAP